MAAGTDLVLHGGDEITTLIDLSDLNLAYVEQRDTGIAIGAMTPLSDLLNHSALATYLGGLIPAVLRTVGSPMLRNVATVGGNLIRRQPWSDVVPLFLALGANARHFDGTEHEETLAEFYGRPGHSPEDILTEIVLPAPKPVAAAAFEKFTRSAVDVALLNCAVFIRTKYDRCVEARVYVGGTPRSAAAVPAVVEMLQGSELDDELISEAARIAAAEVPTGNDRRTTASYRTHLVEVGLGRCLRRIAREVRAA